MTGKVLKTITLLVVCGTLISSCSKYKANQNIINTTSKKGMLSGKWIEFQVGADSNNNNIVDSSELQYSSAAYNTKLTFNVDGSGTYFVHNTAVDSTYAMTWSLENSDADLKIAITGGDTKVFNIHGLNDLYLTLSNTAVSPKTWTIYKKQ
jgi:hypothetical protein